MTVTLTDIERATARKVGPFYAAALDRQIPSISGLDFAVVPNLRSTSEQDLVTNLWLLRRGLDFLGNPVTVDTLDRQRLVASYDSLSGRVVVDRPWSAVPVPGEMVEFHHLDPSMELRVSVRAGLRRCFFEDRFSFGSSLVFEADLTSVLPWLIDPSSIGRVEVSFPSGGLGSIPREIPFRVFGQGGHVCIRLGSGSSGVLVTVYHPHFSWVNGADALDGPLDDDDELDVDLDYAVSAAHIEAWHNFPAKLMSAGAGGLQATQAMAALEFTRQSRIWFPQQPRSVQFSEAFGTGAFDSVVVNA